MATYSLSLVRVDGPDQKTLKFSDSTLALRHHLVAKRSLPVGNSSQPTLKYEVRDSKDLVVNSGLPTQRTQTSNMVMTMSFPASTPAADIETRWTHLKAIVDAEISRIKSGDLIGDSVTYTAP